MRDIDPYDRELRQYFECLREDVSAAAPAFHTLAVGKNTKTKIARRWVPAVAGFATVGAALALAVFGNGETPSELDPALASVVWQGPTDYLLDLPGGSALRTIPEIGFGLSLPTLADPDQNPDDKLR